MGLTLLFFCRGTRGVDSQVPRRGGGGEEDCGDGGFINHNLDSNVNKGKVSCVEARLNEIARICCAYVML
jgi:hypothetical protein